MSGDAVGLRYQIQGFAFWGRNAHRAKSLPPISSGWEGPIHVIGCGREDFATFRRLHADLRDGADLNFWRQMLYRRQGEKLVFLALLEGDLAGFDMFYFREDEPSDVVHEAFIGVDKRFRRRGISSALRRAAIEHFTGAGLCAISSQISPDNDFSLRSALGVGFKVVSGDSAGRRSEQLMLRRPLR